MYKDLICQIAKYLKSKEKYYLLLEIDNIVDDHVYLSYSTFYLVYELNNEIKMKYKLHISIFNFTHYYVDDYPNFKIEDIMMDNDLLITFKEYGTHCQYKSKLSLFIYYEKMELKVIRNDFSYYTNNDSLKSYLYYLINPQNKGENERELNSNNMFLLDSFKLNKQDIGRIKEGVKAFQKIEHSEFRNSKDIENIKLTEKEKKYVKIYTTYRK